MARSTRGEIPDDEAMRRLYRRLLLGAQRRLVNMDLLHETSAEDVVHDALEALLEGHCPPDVDVECFLFNRIRQGVSNRARTRHSRDETLAAYPSPVGCTPPPPQPDDFVEGRELSLEVRAQLHTAVAGDDELAALLHAYESGLRRPAEICQELGMSAAQLRLVRRRLNRRLEQLPSALVAAVYDYLRRAS